MSQKKSWLDRVMVRIKGGDEANLQKFHEGEIKFLNKQIDLHRSQNEECEEKIEEIKAEFKEYLEMPNADQIKTQESRKNYYASFTSGSIAFKERIQKEQDIIDSNDKAIAYYSEIIEALS